MLYVCIPSHNEAPTIGVLLWRIRKVFREFSREYEILVYDDASTDETAAVLEPYHKVLPLTVIRGERRVGYARAVDALLRAAAQRTRYPRRDAVVVMQADFTDQPEQLPELVKRFEGGADIVVAESAAVATAPGAVRSLATWTRRAARLWPVRPHLSVAGVSDPFGTYRILRITVVRDLVRAAGDRPVADGPVRVANLELLRRAVALARRVECVAVEPRYDVRPRETRVQLWPDLKAILRAGWAARKRRGAAAA
ncbi:MAG: glycosyltransferase family 2 protein [Gemmatimonadetes bacterium]|nr:glycosyltransferase family 2 protein [Gemmatimonadota bacterium]